MFRWEQAGSIVCWNSRVASRPAHSPSVQSESRGGRAASLASLYGRRQRGRGREEGRGVGGQGDGSAVRREDRGRAALIQDPTGAFFSVWEAKQRSGVGVTGEPGSFCWADLTTGDQARAKTFYESLFGWKLTLGEGKESGYLHIVNGEKYIGGVPPAHQGSGNEPPHWLIYFAVADVDKAFQRAKDMNARIILRPMDFEGVGRVAMLADPQGAVFALFREAGKSNG